MQRIGFLVLNFNKIQDSRFKVYSLKHITAHRDYKHIYIQVKNDMKKSQYESGSMDGFT